MEKILWTHEFWFLMEKGKCSWFGWIKLFGLEMVRPECSNGGVEDIETLKFSCGMTLRQWMKWWRNVVWLCFKSNRGFGGWNGFKCWHVVVVIE